MGKSVLREGYVSCFERESGENSGTGGRLTATITGPGDAGRRIGQRSLFFPTATGSAESS